MRAHDYARGHQTATRASLQLAAWTLAWTASLALARFGPTEFWDSQAIPSWAAVTANLAVGIGWIFAHARYLQGIDELQRKIVQDALAVTLGIGWVGGFAYLAADSAGLIAREADIGLFAALLGVVYMCAIFIGHLRYR